jgi:hypothetical protein
MSERPSLSRDERDRIFLGIEHRVLRVRRRRRVLAAGAAALIIAGGISAAAMVAVLPSGAVERSVQCYSDAVVDAASAGAQSATSDVPRESAENAVANCRLLWSMGVLHSARVATGAAPAMQACLADDGSFAVYPRWPEDLRTASQLCSSLGRLTP